MLNDILQNALENKEATHLSGFFLVSRDGEIRTHDLLLPKQAF